PASLPSAAAGATKPSPDAKAVPPGLSPQTPLQVRARLPSDSTPPASAIPQGGIRAGTPLTVRAGDKQMNLRGGALLGSDDGFVSYALADPGQESMVLRLPDTRVPGAPADRVASVMAGAAALAQSKLAVCLPIVTGSASSSPPSFIQQKPPEGSLTVAAA